ncbi:MAG: hypothetical protein Q7J47_23010 [Azoarcus sp.]|nr:hypothetical protein [Azoarcus sp.]
MSTKQGLVFIAEGAADQGKAMLPIGGAGTVSGAGLGALFGIVSGIYGAKQGAVAGGVAEAASEIARWTQDVPGLTWPLPAPSARMALPRDTGAWAQGRGLKVGDIATQVQAAMTGAGYAERSFYRVPDGFVLVTRLEQIERDGTPKRGAERWNVGAPSLEESFFLKVLRGMVGATSGNYRLFVFVVSTEDHAPTAVEPLYADAQVWFLRGSAGLASDTAQQPITARHRMSVLVYEFEATRRNKVMVRAPGLLTCEAHLDKAGLWTGLSRLAGADSSSSPLALSRTGGER